MKVPGQTTLLLNGIANRKGQYEAYIKMPNKPCVYTSTCFREGRGQIQIKHSGALNISFKQSIYGKSFGKTT
jgi:hypothetical protein